LGGGGYPFSAGTFNTYGCYAYDEGKFKGIAYYGQGGTEIEMKADPGRKKFRPEGHDCEGVAQATTTAAAGFLLQKSAVTQRIRRVSVPVTHHGPDHYSYQFPSFIQVAEGTPCNCPCEHQLHELELQYRMDREGEDLQQAAQARRIAGQVPIRELYQGPPPEAQNQDEDLGPRRPKSEDMMGFLQKSSTRKGASARLLTTSS